MVVEELRDGYSNSGKEEQRKGKNRPVQNKLGLRLRFAALPVGRMFAIVDKLIYIVERLLLKGGLRKGHSRSLPR